MVDSGEIRFLRTYRNGLWSIARELEQRPANTHQALAGILIGLGNELNRIIEQDGPINLGSIEPNLRDIINRNWLRTVSREPDRSVYPGDVYVRERSE